MVIDDEPSIAEFLSEDMARINERKLEIDEDEWRRTIECANEYIAKYKYVARDGRPYRSWIPAFNCWSPCGCG